jgi:hypothetical protein
LDRGSVQPQASSFWFGANEPDGISKKASPERKKAKKINDTSNVNQSGVDEGGLPTGCCAPIHNPSLAAMRGPPGYEQASPVNKPTPEQAKASNCSESTIAHLVENTYEVKKIELSVETG